MNASKNASGNKMAWRNAGLPMATLGLFLMAGCDAESQKNVIAEIGSNTASTAGDESADNGPAPKASEIARNVQALPTPNVLPADVVAFKTRRDDCDHFRGEDPGDDEARATELSDKLDKTCKGTDAELASLRRRYLGDANVTSALANYEDTVE